MSDISMRRDGAVGTIAIARPARFNSLDVTTARDLRRAALDYARDDGITRRRADRIRGCLLQRRRPEVHPSRAVMTRDLGYLMPAARAVPRGYGEIFKQILEYLHSTISEIRRSSKPFIAAVDGIAAAGGFGLAMSCDLVMASPRATFEWAYSKTGLTGAESSTFLLPKLVGFRRAMELMLLNPRLTAEQARAAGSSRPCPPQDGFDAAGRGAGRAAHRRGPRARVRRREGADERGRRHRSPRRPPRSRAGAARAQRRRRRVPEGIEAFFEKRPADFERAG